MMGVPLSPDRRDQAAQLLMTYLYLQRELEDELDDLLENETSATQDSWHFQIFKWLAS